MAEVGPQVSGSKVALTRIGTLLVSSEPQMSAAYWKAINRWAPSVVPTLPPTGATGVGSLNPSPGPSLLMTVKVAARARPAGATIDVTSRANTSNPISDSSLRETKPLFRLGVLHADLSFAVDGDHQRVLKPPLEVELDPAAGNGAHLLDQTLVRRAERVAELRRQGQGHGAGRWLLHDRARLRVDVDRHPGGGGGGDPRGRRQLLTRLHRHDEAAADHEQAHEDCNFHTHQSCSPSVGVLVHTPILRCD